MALVLAPEPPLEDWLDALDAQVNRSPSFFSGRPVVLDLGALPSDQPDVPEERKSAPTQDSNSLLIDQPVRSGQSIAFERGDVTIVGSVASGAEVIAGGSIHIYGTLRGRAIAGLTGNSRARIFCRKMEAELLAIDGIYQTADDMSAALRGKPVQAWLAGEAMMLATLD
jgi:septum site-determining protein MinC